MNAIGYATLAGAMVLPGPVARSRWFVRIALIGFTLATIAGWVLFGARYPIAYLDKGIEVVLVLVLAFEIWLVDGGPVAVFHRLLSLTVTAARLIGARAGRRPDGTDSSRRSRQPSWRSVVGPRPRQVARPPPLLPMAP